MFLKYNIFGDFMNRLIMIKYGELTTKKANRKIFINLLENNIKKILGDLEYIIRKDRVRMYIECSESNLDIIIDKLNKVFGIHGIVIAYKVETDVDKIKSKVLELIDSNYKTFKINTKRADKTFEIHSMDFNNIIGGFVLKNSNLKVDVHNPDIIFNIEIRNDGTYIYTILET